jgi:hypothetical protein
LRNLATRKATGCTKTGRINPVKVTKWPFKSVEEKNSKSYTKTEGIDLHELERRKSAGECLCCAWPSDRKGAHRVKDCIQPIRLDKGTASHPKDKA